MIDEMLGATRSAMLAALLLASMSAGCSDESSAPATASGTGGTSAGGDGGSGGSAGESGGSGGSGAAGGSGGAAGGGGPSSSHPGMFLDDSEITAVRARLASNDEPWASAMADAIGRADAALGQPPVGVTDQGDVCPGLTAHEYCTERPYCGWAANPYPSLCDYACDFTGTCCDGCINPDADRADYEALMDVTQASVYLALAYVLTDEVSYASHAVALLEAWSVDSATSMTPAFTKLSDAAHGSQSVIEIVQTMPGLFYAADLLWSYSGWAAPSREAFAAWTCAMGAAARDDAGPYANNWEDARLLFMATAGVSCEDDDLVEAAMTSAPTLLPDQIDVTGQLVEELSRTKDFDYSMMALALIAKLAEVGRHRGVDLYGFVGPGGAGSLETAFDFHAPFVADPSTWPHDQTDYAGEHAAAFELAYRHWEKAVYLTAVEQTHDPVGGQSGPPLHDRWVMGPVTLTHAWRP